MTLRRFDLNVEEILENWDTADAIREVISNALDEQLLTQSKDVEIVKKGDMWIIKDFGRGVEYKHFTQKENLEKVNHNSVIGKFGIGLKDALSTFDRKGLRVVIKSKFSDITISKNRKEGFLDIETLHANIINPTSPEMIGTEFIIYGVWDIEIKKAKNLFLKFSGDEVIATTSYGEVIKNANDVGIIYINGVKAAEEPEFLFSYNITKKTSALKKALNRERANVGRAAYSDIVKRILLESISIEVVEKLAEDFQGMRLGTSHYETLNWKDVKLHVIKNLNQTGTYVFFTQDEIDRNPCLNDTAKCNGKTIVIIDESIGSSLQGLKDLSGNPITGMTKFANDYYESFEFQFIDLKKLSEKEKEIYNYTPSIIKLFGGLPKNVKEIKIATKLREDFSSFETSGCWDEKTNSIIIDRETLQSLSDYSGVLIHEIIHAKTGTQDVTREFETQLTEAIGLICENSLM